MSDSTDLVPAARRELEALKQGGAHAVARQRAVSDLERQIEGAEWGSGNSVVKGSSMSDATRQAFAHFCAVTRANPQIHVDLLGGKPYLNAEYWRDRCASDPAFMGDEQINIAPDVPLTMRQRAAELRAAVEDLAEDPERRAALKAKALELEMRAEEIEDLRSKWQVPVWATSAYVTRIKRLANSAPLEAIREGKVEVAPWILVVEECNWAGGRPPQKFKSRQGGDYEKQTDPVGELEPEKTARSRSYRRTGRKAFPAWMDEFDRVVHEAEEYIEADFEVIRSEYREEAARLPDADGPQAIGSGAGEPDARRPTEDARELPTRSTAGSTPPRESAPTPAPDPEPAAEPEEEGFDVAAARREYFALLRDAGVAEERRHEFQKDHSLPSSTKQWTPEHWRRAIDIARTTAELAEEHAAGADEDLQPGDLPFDEPEAEDNPEAPGDENAEDDPDAEGEEAAEPEPEPFDRDAELERLKAAVKLAQLDNRSTWTTWTTRHNFPVKMGEWSDEDFSRARPQLLRALKGTFGIAARQVGRSAKDLHAEVLLREPETVEDYAALFARVEELAGGDS